MMTSMLLEADADFAHSLPVSIDKSSDTLSRDNSWKDYDGDGRQGAVPQFQGFEPELKQMQIIQNQRLACAVWAELEPLAELAERLVSELEAERRDLRYVTLDEMKHRMVVARRAQLMAG